MHYIQFKASRFKKEGLKRRSRTYGGERCTIIYCSYALFNATVGEIVFVCI